MNETVFTRFWAILTAPEAVMEAVRHDPRWTAAALVTLLLVGFTTGATLHITGPEQMEMMENSRLMEIMPPEDIDEMWAEYDEISMSQRLTTGLQGGFGTLFAVFIMCLVYGLFGKLAAGTGTFRQVMGVCFWASYVGLGLSSLLKLPIVLSKGSSLDVSIGPAILFAGNGPTDAVFQFLSIFEFFTLWAVWLMIVGFERIHGFSRGKAAAVVVPAWLLMSLVMFGLTRAFM